MEKLYTVNEAAEIFRVCSRTLRNWIRDGKIEVLRIGGGLRLTQSVIEKKMQKT